MRLLKPGGTMILSHPGIGEVPVQDKTVVVDSRSYGEAHLTKIPTIEISLMSVLINIRAFLIGKAGKL